MAKRSTTTGKPDKRAKRPTIWFDSESTAHSKIERLGKLIAQELPEAMRTVRLTSANIVEIALDEALARRAGKR